MAGRLTHGGQLQLPGHVPYSCLRGNLETHPCFGLASALFIILPGEATERLAGAATPPQSRRLGRLILIRGLSLGVLRQLLPESLQRRPL